MRYIIIVLAGYFLGALSSSIILSKAKYYIDIRKDGSGNAGATNMARVHGMGAGLLTLGGDMLKTAVSGGLGWWLAGRLGLILACAACLIGHCWPVYYRFKGGKGVSVSVMIALLLDWKLLLILAVVFFTVFAVTRRVSACSVISALLFVPAYLLCGGPADAGLWLGVMVTLIVVFCHRSNIRRLLRGEEQPFVPKKKG